MDRRATADMDKAHHINRNIVGALNCDEAWGLVALVVLLSNV